MDNRNSKLVCEANLKHFQKPCDNSCLYKTSLTSTAYPDTKWYYKLVNQLISLCRKFNKRVYGHYSIWVCLDHFLEYEHGLVVIDEDDISRVLKLNPKSKIYTDLENLIDWDEMCCNCTQEQHDGTW